MWNADDDPIALGVRAAVGDEDLSLVPDSVAWPSGEQLEHLGARYAGLARSFPTLDDYGIRFSDWQYRATPFDEPDLTVLPAWLRDQLGTECADGLDNDGDGLVDHPDDPACRTHLSAKENPKCQRRDRQRRRRQCRLGRCRCGRSRQQLR